jgi:hypothetical protein
VTTQDMQGSTAFADRTLRSFLGGRCAHSEQCGVDLQRSNYLREQLTDPECAGNADQTRTIHEALMGRCVVLAKVVAGQAHAERAAGYVGLLADYGDRDRMSVAGALFDVAGRRLTVVGWITERPAGQEELAVATFCDPPEPTAGGIRFHPAVQRRRFADPSGAIREFAAAAGLRRGWTS